MRIPVFITGDSDFTIENINILSVYSPVVIAAPCGCEPAPLSGEGEYAKIRGRHNVIDFHRSADNVTIRNALSIRNQLTFRREKARMTLSFRTKYGTDKEGKASFFIGALW